MNKRYSVHNIFLFLNIVFVILSIVGYNVWEKSSYVDGNTIILNSVLAIITTGIIIDAKKNKNHLLLLLAAELVLFFNLRVSTLNYTDFSECLGRSNSSYCDVNNCLLYSIALTLMLWAGLHFKNRKNNQIKQIKYNSVDICRLSKRFIIFVLISFFVLLYVTIIGGALALLIVDFFNVLWVMLMASAFFIFSWETVPSLQKRAFIFLCVAFIIWFTVAGSRSAIITIGRVLACAFLTVGYYRIKRKYVFAILLSIPIAAGSFLFATALRQTANLNSTFSEKLELINVVKDNSEAVSTRVVLAPIFDRIGFLDYSTEMCKMRKPFSEFINIERELKSIVDNVLSPGFTVFDVPRMSNTIVHYYDYGITNPKLSVSKNLPDHSDQLCLYGESCLLFGYIGGIIFVFFVGVVFKSLWRMNKSEDILNIIKRASLLLLFTKIFDSFGLDWFCVDTIQMLLVYFVVKNYVINVNVRKDGKNLSCNVLL